MEEFGGCSEGEEEDEGGCFGGRWGVVGGIGGDGGDVGHFNVGVVVGVEVGIVGVGAEIEEETDDAGFCVADGFGEEEAGHGAEKFFGEGELSRLMEAVGLDEAVEDEVGMGSPVTCSVHAQLSTFPGVVGGVCFVGVVTLRDEFVFPTGGDPLHEKVLTMVGGGEGDEISDAWYFNGLHCYAQEIEPYLDWACNFLCCRVVFVAVVDFCKEVVNVSCRGVGDEDVEVPPVGY